MTRRRRRWTPVAYLEYLQQRSGSKHYLSDRKQREELYTDIARRRYAETIQDKRRFAEEYGFHYDAHLATTDDIPGLSEILTTRPVSKFEDPSFYFILQSLLDTLPVRLNKPPVLGTLP